MTDFDARPSFSAQVRRKLLLRLGVLAGAVAAVVGIADFAVEERRRMRDCATRVFEALSRFEVLAQSGGAGIPDEQTLSREFVRLVERAPVRHRSWVIETGRLIAPDGRLLVSHPVATPRLEQRLAFASRSRSDPARTWHSSEAVGGERYLLLGGPVRSAAGDVLGRVEGAVRLSPELIGEIRGGAAQAGLWAALIVLTTAVATYPITMRLTRRLIVLSGNLLQANIDTAQVLGSAIAKRDGDTAEHNSRVTLISVRIAEAYGLDDASIRNLIKGAFVHDVGKIAIRDSILLKPGRLTREEFEVMKTHVREGVEIVERSDWLNEGLTVVRDHHEKFDGSGYLQGLKGEAIPVQARIFAIADVFDALTSRRPYKEPLSFEETMAVLENGRGTHFDPELLDAFVPIAPTLYRELIERPTESPHMSLRRMVAHYFSRLTGELRI